MKKCKAFFAGCLCLSFLFSVLILKAQTSAITRGFNFRSAVASAAIDNRAIGCQAWAVTYNSSGFSALSIQLESAPDANGVPGTFVAFAGAIQTGTGLTTNPATLTTQGTIQGTGYFGWIRVNLTSVTGTGLVTGAAQCQTPQPAVAANGGGGAGTTTVQGTTASGSPATGNPVQVAGIDEFGNARAVKVLSNGSVNTEVNITGSDAVGNNAIGFALGGNVSVLPVVGNYLFNGASWDRIRAAPGTIGVQGVNTEGTKTSYRTAKNFSPVATAATDIFTITGSGTKVVRVTRLGIACTATAAIATDVIFLVRSTADTAGTSTSSTAVPLDSTNAAATATVLAYTANPTTGTLVGAISDDKASITATSGAPQFYFEDFTVRNAQGLVLRGITQVLAINLNGATIAGIACAAEAEWTEE